jgi:Holliday junction resolvase
MQRRKGASGERELFALLSDLLGYVVRRNIEQARVGGADGLDVPGWAIECKRCERLEIPAWWAQALRQAEATGRKPVLFYRQSRKPWLAMVDAADLAPTVFEQGRETATLRLEAAAQLMRSDMR